MGRGKVCRSLHSSVPCILQPKVLLKSAQGNLVLMPGIGIVRVFLKRVPHMLFFNGEK